ncbi:MAG TPA: phospholipase D family protein, partial [Steroidobacteraceae bacterium]
MTRAFAFAVIAAALSSACSTIPPGADFPKTSSSALEHPEETRLGRQFATAARQHDGTSGFRILTVGVDGFLARAQMIDAAERTLDLQYFIFHGDETGRLLAGKLRQAADRGVRVRLLIDDGATDADDEQILALDARPGIEIRFFNPFAYRGHRPSLRATEFLFNHSRLDYRMHNKLLVADNAVALVGGRNIGNQYFQMDPESQFADDDVFVAGPIAAKLSATFDEFWNSAFAIPAQALRHGHGDPPSAASVPPTEQPREALAPLQAPGIDYVARLSSGEPFAGLVSGRLPLVWAPAQVVFDSPDKKNVESGNGAGRLMTRSVVAAAREVKSELLMVTPYFVPAEEELQLLKDLRDRHARVRILTNSLESNPDPMSHCGYKRYRVPLLEDGVELHEVRSQLESTRGSGQTAAVSRYGNYALHAKLFVFDRRKLLIGSMNFDQRSKRLNTEVGLIIDSPELAQQTALRFEAMAQPEESYRV